jgi:sirohydrochlorin ferrochelatase
MKDSTQGFVVFAHGSRIESANEAVRNVAAEMARAGGFDHVEAAFLELGVPDLAGAVDRLAGRGVKRVAILPYFLTLGLHMERDLPRLAQEVAAKHPGVEVTVGKPLDGHPALAAILVDRARENSR